MNRRIYTVKDAQRRMTVTDRPRVRWMVLALVVCVLAYAGMLTMCAYHGVKSLRTTIEARHDAAE